MINKMSDTEEETSVATSSSRSSSSDESEYYFVESSSSSSSKKSETSDVEEEASSDYPIESDDSDGTCTKSRCICGCDPWCKTLYGDLPSFQEYTAVDVEDTTEAGRAYYYKFMSREPSAELNKRYERILRLKTSHPKELFEILIWDETYGPIPRKRELKDPSQNIHELSKKLFSRRQLTVEMMALELK